MPAAFMTSELAEQPDVLARILRDVPAAAEAVAAPVREARPRFVLLAARGASDHAALYGKYLVEVLLGWPAGLASPSTMTAYGARPDLRDVLFIAVSQSGASPDLVASTATARECGALTLAVTNDASSALAGAAELHVDMLAGVERAVTATKTYTAELLTMRLLVAALAGSSDLSDVAGVPDGVASLVAAGDDAIAAGVSLLRSASRLITTGRGFSYPTAREAALKLMETCYLSAQAFSGADLLHGPLALVDEDVPVLASVASGPGGDAMAPVLSRLRERSAALFVVGSESAVASAGCGVALPDGFAEHVSPILEIVPFQRLALQLALARGIDPDSPRGLSKVTETL